MKKIISILAMFFLISIIMLNIIFSANLTSDEHIEIKYNNFIDNIFIIVMLLVVYFSANALDSLFHFNMKYRKVEFSNAKIFKILLLIYNIIVIIWAISVNPKVVGDSVHVCNLAQVYSAETYEELLEHSTYAGISLKQYMAAYPQQISLAFAFSLFFRLIHFNSIIELLRVLNIIGIMLIVLAIYKINILLSQKYKINKILLLLYIFTFASLFMLVTYIYGDIPSLALSLLCVYFMMKYVESNKIKYFFYASFFMMFAYMFRMNSLIFVIATIIYLFLNVVKERKTSSPKQNLIKIVMIIGFIAISIFPSFFIKNYYLNKYQLNKEDIYPVESYFLMSIEESPRANGWYNEDIANKALANPNTVKEEYIKKIENRLEYFVNNLDYTFKFYIMKLASMWTENTYSAIQNNIIENNHHIENFAKPLAFYQKILLILICLCSFIVLIQNRKNLTLEVIFLLTIFVGGFIFHILWEAKSRYIIPYIIVLMPIASINLQKKIKIGFPEKYCKHFINRFFSNS